MRESRPWFRFDPVAFYGMDAVAAMDSESVGVYLWLCTRQWQSGPLPSDEDSLKRILRGRVSKWSKVWPQVRAGFEEIGGRLVAAWIEVERAVADAFLAKQKANGQLGGRPRKPKRNPRVSHGEPMANPDLTQPNPTQSHRPDRTVQRPERDKTGQEEEKSAHARADSPPEIPAALNRPDVIEALEEYERGRKAGRHKPAGLRALYAKLEPHGPEKAVQALRDSTANGWLGVFPEKLNGNGHHPPVTGAAAGDLFLERMRTHQRTITVEATPA